PLRVPPFARLESAGEHRHIGAFIPERRNDARVEIDAWLFHQPCRVSARVPGINDGDQELARGVSAFRPRFFLALTRISARLVVRITPASGRTDGPVGPTRESTSPLGVLHVSTATLPAFSPHRLAR